MESIEQPGSSSLTRPGYWWHRARADLLEVVLAPYFDAPATVLDVGSADGPSVGWMIPERHRVTLDIVPAGLVPGQGVCGSATELPFRNESFEVVAAFDVVEHCEDEVRAVTELSRVLAPGGRLLLSVPAYQWAWSDHDVRAGHYRRYTRHRLVELVEGVGLSVHRTTHAFTSVFPFFLAERVQRRLGQRLGRPSDDRLPEPPRAVERMLERLCHVDGRLLRRHDLPFGSSIFLAASKPA